MQALTTPKNEGSFSSSLSVLDRERLRQVIRRVHFRHYPTSHQTDYEADKLIDALGAEVGQRMIKQALDAGKL
jgi:hypothetical protein